MAAEPLEAMRRLIAAMGRPVRRFADLGCGGGAMAGAVLEWYPKAHAVLVDFSEPLLEAARARFAGSGARVEIVAGDMATSAWSRAVARYAPFGLVVSGLAIHHLTDERKRALYGEVLRLLAPGGLFLNFDHVASGSPWAEAVHDAWVVDRLFASRAPRQPTLTRDEVEREYRDRQDRMANILAPVEEQCRWLRDAGFQDVDIFSKAFEFALFGGRAGSTGGRPLPRATGRR